MVVAIVVVVALGALLVAGIWYGLRGTPNSGPALGNNSPYPTDLSGEEPPYLPSPIISVDEEFRRDADARLQASHHQKNR